MISLEIPQVNIMTKMDLLSKKAKKEIEKWVHGLHYNQISIAEMNLLSFIYMWGSVCL